MQISNTTNNSELDQYISQEVLRLERFFSQDIDFYFGTETNRSGNAFFTPRCDGFRCHGSIVLGKWLMVDMFKNGRNLNNLSAILAHEFAHSLQYFFGWYGASPLKELHADYLAGYYMAHKTNLSQSELENSISDFYNIGDFNFNSIQHHGTPEERACSFIMGFKLGRQGGYSVGQAFQAGKKYVIDRNPCYKYRQSEVNQPNYFNSLPPESAALASVALIAILSNDIYYNRITAFSRNIIPEKEGFTYGYGYSLGLRKEWTRCALEYGFSSVKYKPTFENQFGNETKGFEQNFAFDLSFVHNVFLNRAPYPLKPYIGVSSRLGSRSGIGAIIGSSIPLINRLKFDVRYEIGLNTNFLRFGLIFKYQKTYFWNK
tara:strand:+ start:1055 stop:2176 length:1122 start_codon:yes stop_codon:yes gene_type:complete